MSNTRSYQDDLPIRPENLPDELMEQAVRYGYWADLWAEAVFRRDETKRELELLESEVDNDVRERELMKTGKKPTEEFIRKAVVSNDKYQELLMKYNEANLDVNLFSNAKVAFEHRKTTLVKLVEMTLADFYSVPKMPESLEYLEERRKEKRFQKESSEILKNSPRLNALRRRRQDAS